MKRALLKKDSENKFSNPSKTIKVFEDFGEKRKNKSKPMKKISKWLYWTPRVLSIIFILFIAMFSLDVFGNNYTFWETILGLFMNNIPTFVLIIFLIIAWKWEWVGAIGFILAGLLYVFLTLFMNEFQWYYLAWNLQISVPAFIIGILWWMNWVKKR